MATHSTGFDLGRLSSLDKLNDPGDAGSLSLGSRGYAVVEIASGSATDSFVLPAATPGTLVIVVNNSGGGLVCNDPSGAATLTLTSAENGLAVSKTEDGASSLWCGVVLTATAT